MSTALAQSMMAFGAVGLASAPALAPARPLIAARNDSLKQRRERKAPMQIAALRALAVGDALPREVSRLAGLDGRNVSSVLCCLLARGWAVRVKPKKSQALRLHGNVSWLYRMTAAGRKALEAAAA